MRIGMMADVYKAHVSGVTHYVELNKRYLEKVGHEVFVFTFGDQQSEDGDARVVCSPGLPLLDTGYRFSFSYSRPAKKLLQTMDVVHVQHPFVSGRLALRYCQPLYIPIAFTNHTRYDLYAQAYLPILPVEISGSLLQAYMPRFCQAMSLIISPSAGMAQVLRRMGVTSPIDVIPNGVELDRFYGAKALSRQEFGYDEADVLVVYAGRVANEKNLGFLLRAFAGVAAALGNVHLLVIGAGSRPIEAELQQQVQDLQLGQRVRFTGMVSYDDLPSYLLMCDVFATASVTEVHPLSVIEGMACGLPIMGIMSPGVGDTVEDGKTGFLAGEDLPSFTAKLVRLCMDAALRRQMGEAARQASAQYSIERTSRMLLEHYERLVSASRPHRDGLTVRLRSFFESYKE
jgi:glycosyltransferase involved in cell wall biosynthesis